MSSCPFQGQPGPLLASHSDPRDGEVPLAPCAGPSLSTDVLRPPRPASTRLQGNAEFPHVLLKISCHSPPPALCSVPGRPGGGGEGWKEGRPLGSASPRQSPEGPGAGSLPLGWLTGAGPQAALWPLEGAVGRHHLGPRAPGPSLWRRERWPQPSLRARSILPARSLAPVSGPSAGTLPSRVLPTQPQRWLHQPRRPGCSFSSLSHVATWASRHPLSVTFTHVPVSFPDFNCSDCSAPA